MYNRIGRRDGRFWAFWAVGLTGRVVESHLPGTTPTLGVARRYRFFDGEKWAPSVENASYAAPVTTTALAFLTAVPRKRSRVPRPDRP